VAERNTKAPVVDERILANLDAPRTAGEIGDLIHREALDDWLERHPGYDFEWFSDDELPGARLLASCGGRDRGLRYHPWEIYPRLVALEKRGLVERITPPGGRGIIWVAVAAGGEPARLELLHG
jgi:hypothetical protein